MKNEAASLPAVQLRYGFGPNQLRLAQRLMALGLAMIGKSLAVWIGLLLIAIANGTFRVAVLEARLEEQAAHVISAAMLCVLILLLTLATIGWIGPQSRADAVVVGVLWLTLTIGFELGFGHFIADRPWPELLYDYNVLKGRVTALVLGTTAAAPYLAALFRRVL